jgi:hypothetical protein
LTQSPRSGFHRACPYGKNIINPTTRAIPGFEKYKNILLKKMSLHL